MTFPLDKLGLLNQALQLCGDNTINTYNDGSDEWNVASAAYEAAIEFMIEDHGWKGLTNIVQVQRAGPSPDDQFADAYNKPTDCVHLIWVRLSLSGLSSDDTATVYRIIGNQICLNANGSPPSDNSSAGDFSEDFSPDFAIGSTATLGTVTVKYVSNANLNPANGYLTRKFMSALLAFVRAGIYGGLHEDTVTEMKWMEVANGILKDARARSDQEEPKRAMFNHRITAARRIRRPWPPVSNEWGGTGSPG